MSGRNNKKGALNKTGALPKYFCSEHGENATHTMDMCFTLQNRAAKAKGNAVASAGGRSFSTKTFKKDLHALSKGNNRMDVIDAHMSFLKKEKAKTVAQAKKSKAKVRQARKHKHAVTDPESDSSSDSDSSRLVHVIDRALPSRAELVAQLRAARSTETTLRTEVREAMRAQLKNSRKHAD